MQFLPELTPGSAEWKERRKKYITGTDIAPLMLKKEMKPSWMATRAEIYLEKIGELPDKPENAAMRRGRAMEEPTAQRYAQRRGFKVYTCPMIVDGYFAANIDRLVGMPDAPACTPDGQTITAKKIAEIKTASSAWGQNAPMYYYGQPQWYMGFLPDCESADIVCWFGDRVKNVKDDEPDEDFAIYPQERNQAFIDSAREVATEFMEKYVIPRVFPDPECEDECRIKWAVSNTKLDYLTAKKTIANAVAAIRKIDAKMHALNEKREAKVFKVMKAMGEIPFLKDENGNMLVTWKSNKPKTETDWEGAAKKFIPQLTPELIAKYTSTPAPVIDWKKLAAEAVDGGLTDEQIGEFTKVIKAGARPFKIAD